MRVIALIALCLTLSLPTANAQISPETVSVETMPTPGANWFISKTGEGAYIFDAASGEMHGLLSLSGYQAPGVEPSQTRNEFYAAESYYSRRWRGERTDVVTVYDFANLSPIAEIEIPKKIAILSFRGHMRLTNNSKHLGVFNMTPAQSVSIVDVESRQFVGEISTPGCAIIMPVADNDFMMLCGDGTLQLIELDNDGEEANRTRSNKFFDVQVDPVYDHPVETANGWLLVSHNGKVFNVTQSGSQMRVSEPWALLVDEDVADNWRPGGHQLYSVHKGLGLAYILMHQGEQYTHHDAGSEVWVLDISAQRRIARIELEQPADNILVTQESEPLLIIAGGEIEGKILVFDAISMKLVNSIEDSGPGTDLLVDF